MPLIRLTLIAASLAAAGAISAIAVTSYDATRADAGRTYDWSAESSFSGDVRRARTQATTPSRQTTPFSRIALESLT